MEDLRIELPMEEDFNFDDEKIVDASKVKLKEVINREQQQMIFAYDHGDNWKNSLILETIIVDKELPGRKLPRVLDGEGYGIIEDCGGTGGLKN
jgi:Plasmid pRiA4b ORF-3-like protein.